jgi:NAD(P)-dependent dehydrogenase (short-subunit alcohol dehydrogenase family)
MNSKATPINSELAGQVAVVTGGGRGIGCAIAVTLSAPGMTMAILARFSVQAASTCPTQAAIYRGLLRYCQYSRCP